MKKTLIIIAMLVSASSVGAQDPMRVMTFNIRYNNPGDSLDAWPNRVAKAISQIRFHQVHLLGVQEALYGQITDLDSGLTQYRHIGVGRDDGAQKGEFSAIYYDTNRLAVLESGTFWLSETTSVPGSKGWDAALPRIVTWGLFADKSNGKSFYAFNTHFDHIGKIARRESARLLLQRVHSMSGKKPAIVTGDFNSTPADEPIRILMDKSNPDHLINTADISAEPHYGPKGTFNAFGKSDPTDSPIDYIFITGGFKVSQHATLTQSWKGHFSSDHFPVFAVLQVQ